ncbi:MAG: ATP-binding protein [Actinobacteria bacterium]|nr:ATP-binding protein [Actinomycetota bacterium]
MARNPFTPTFGVSPPLLVGRAELLDDFAGGLEDGPGAPARMTLYTGARGTGKTVMLNEVEDLARQRGWRVISETATVGLVNRLVTEHLPALLGEIDPGARVSKVTGINAPMGLGGATWVAGDAHAVAPALRTQLASACELLAATGTGMLLTLDEIHRHGITELREVATVMQHLLREDREIAFAGAGLPSAVSGVLRDDVLTFLRRADRHALGPVALPDVAVALVEPIATGGRKITAGLARRAAQATGGYPFLIQLVGYHIWRQQPRHLRISQDDVEAGIVAARRRLGSLVHEPAISDLSGVDRTFLLAMAHDDGPSKMGDIAARLDVDANYASQYRLRLIATELIEPVGHGRVDFAMPYLRDFLREHVALEAQLDDFRRG